MSTKKFDMVLFLMPFLSLIIYIKCCRNWNAQAVSHKLLEIQVHIQSKLSMDMFLIQGTWLREIMDKYVANDVIRYPSMGLNEAFTRFNYLI